MNKRKVWFSLIVTAALAVLLTGYATHMLACDTHCISGQVKIDGMYMKGVDVKVTHSGNLVAQTTTDKNGAYEFCNLQLNTKYEVEATYNGISAAENKVYVNDEECEEINLEIETD